MEAEKRLAGVFFRRRRGRTTINYLWAHTVKCPNCESVMPLSPNWWLYRRLGESNYRYWCAVKPIKNISNKKIDFQLVSGGKGRGKTVKSDEGDYDPDTLSTISRGVAKCIKLWRSC